MAKTLCTLLNKDVPFEFIKEYMQAFVTLNENLTLTTIIAPLDWSLPFEIMCDTSDYAIGAVLG